MNYKYYIKIIINVISDTTFLLWKILIFREVMEIFPRQFLIPIRILILRIKRNVGDFFPFKVCAVMLCGLSWMWKYMELLLWVAFYEVILCFETGDPDKELNPKKKTWEQIQPDLHTNDQCVATYKGVPFEVKGKGVCRAETMANSGIK